MIDEDNIITTGNEYIRNGVAYTRISRILGGFVPDGLLNWYKRTSKAKIDKMFKVSTEIGSLVDEWAECYAFGNEFNQEIPDDYLEAYSNCINAFAQWVADDKPVFNDSQVTRFDDRLKVAGSRDFRINEYTILDVKTGTKINQYPIKKSYWLQVNKYADMESCVDIRKVAIVVLDKDTGEYRYEEREVNQDVIDVFDGMVNTYRYFNS
jgi:hypothetical protein